MNMKASSSNVCIAPSVAREAAQGWTSAPLVPTDFRLQIGRFVADSEANKTGAGSYFDIFHSSKRQRVGQCALLLMTGGSCARDRASPFSTLEAWQQQLVMVVIDEGQQYGGDREVASVAMLPPHMSCGVDWRRAADSERHRKGSVPDRHYGAPVDL